MRPVAGKSSVQLSVRLKKGTFGKREDTVSYPVNSQDSNPRSELTFVRAQRFTNFAIKAIYALRTGSSYCPQSVNCFYSKVGKTLRSHTLAQNDTNHTSCVTRSSPSRQETYPFPKRVFRERLTTIKGLCIFFLTSKVSASSFRPSHSSLTQNEPDTSLLCDILLVTQSHVPCRTLLRVTLSSRSFA
jgi:hypothetical protein